LLGGGRGTLHWDRLHRRPEQLHIVAIGPIHRQPHGNTIGFSQHAAFDPRLTPVRWVGPGFSPHPGGLWSWPHPCSANSSPVPSIHRNAPARPAIASRTPPQQPILENAGGPWSRSRFSFGPTPSTGNQCGAHRKYHWRIFDPAPAAGLRPTDGYSHAEAIGGPAPPIAPPTPEMIRWWDWSVWLGRCAWVGVPLVFWLLSF
jgi:hypothetical protein